MYLELLCHYVMNGYNIVVTKFVIGRLTCRVYIYICIYIYKSLTIHAQPLCSPIRRLHAHSIVQSVEPHLCKRQPHNWD